MLHSGFMVIWQSVVLILCLDEGVCMHSMFAKLGARTTKLGALSKPMFLLMLVLCHR